MFKQIPKNLRHSQSLVQQIDQNTDKGYI